MRILMVGAGATGGYYGGRLALANRDVTFLVRGKRAEQLRQDGIRIEGPSGNATFASPKIITAAELNEPYDVVILSTKAYSLEGAMNDIAPVVGPSTILLPILNGMRHLDVLAERFGGRRVLGGSVRIVCDMDSDGVIHQMTPLNHFSFGALPSQPVDAPTPNAVILSGARSAQSKDLHSLQPSITQPETTAFIPAADHVQSTSSTARSAALRDTLNVPGITLALVPDIIDTMWQKWWFLATMGAVGVLGGGTVGDIVATGPHGIEMIKSVQREALAIAAANGHPADANFAATNEQRMTAQGSTLTSSMFRDMIKGLPVEADHILGDLLARANGTPAPLLAAAYTHLKVYEGRRA